MAVDPTIGLDLSFAEILASLSYALDLTSGHPMGHAQRACLIGCRLGADLGLPPEQLSSLYYALLVKDSGCSSNAARMYEIFGNDDIEVKRASRVADWSNLLEAAKYAAANTLPQGTMLARATRLVQIATHQDETSGDLMLSRCTRGAQIARSLGLGKTPPSASAAWTNTGTGEASPRTSRGTRSRFWPESPAWRRRWRCSPARSAGRRLRGRPQARGPVVRPAARPAGAGAVARRAVLERPLA